MFIDEHVRFTSLLVRLLKIVKANLHSTAWRNRWQNFCKNLKTRSRKLALPRSSIWSIKVTIIFNELVALHSINNCKPWNIVLATSEIIFSKCLINWKQLLGNCKLHSNALRSNMLTRSEKFQRGEIWSKISWNKIVHLVASDTFIFFWRRRTLCFF